MAMLVFPAAGTGVSASLDLPGSRRLEAPQGHWIPCKGSDERLGQEFDLGQAPCGSGGVKGSMQESRAGCYPLLAVMWRKRRPSRDGWRSSGNL